MAQNISINLSSKNATTKIQPSHKSPVCFPVVLRDRSPFWRHFSNFPNKLRSSQESREKSFVCSLSVTCVLQFGFKKKKKSKDLDQQVALKWFIFSLLLFYWWQWKYIKITFIYLSAPNPFFQVFSCIATMKKYRCLFSPLSIMCDPLNYLKSEFDSDGGVGGWGSFQVSLQVNWSVASLANCRLLSICLENIYPSEVCIV